MSNDLKKGEFGIAREKNTKVGSQSKSDFRRIRGKKIIDGTGDIIEESPTIVTKDNNIVFVGSEDDIPDKFKNLNITDDWSDQYILPGLIDSHVHTNFGTGGRSYKEVMLEDCNERLIIRGVENLKTHLQAGVTTMRDMGGRDKTTIHLADACWDDIFSPAPRLLASGPPVTQTGGHFWFCNGEADGTEGVRKQVRWLSREGADFIKIMGSGGGTEETDKHLPSYTVKELKAIVEEAHRHEMLTTIHCISTESIRNAVEAEVDCIEHAGFVSQSDKGGWGSHQSDTWVENNDNRGWDQQIAEEFVEKGIWFSPTVQTGFRRRQQLLAKESEVGLTDEEREMVDYLSDKIGSQVEQNIRMWNLGANFAMGTDAISEFGDYALGLELFNIAGMSPHECIQVATSRTAAAIGMDHEVGSLTAGKKADIISVNEDPLESISNIKTIQKVIIGGDEISVEFDQTRFKSPTESDIWPEGRENMSWIPDN